MRSGSIITAFLIALAVFLAVWNFLSPAIAAASGGLAAILWLIIVKLRTGKEKSSPEEMALLFALAGGEAETKAVYSTLPENLRIKLKPPYFVTEIKGRRVVVAVLYKFLDLSREDIAAAHRFAEKEGINRIIILTSGRKRSVLQLTALLPERFDFPTKRRVYKYLADRNALPARPVNVKKNKFKALSFEELTELLLDPAKLKYYFITAAAFLLMSVFFEWYFYMAALPLLFAAATSLRAARHS